MKKLLYLSLILSGFLVSCEMLPRAYFSASPGDPVVGEDVWFTNESDNAASFEWDFGDGFISHDVNPIHNFTASGIYNVTLKVWSSNGAIDESSLSIDVKIPTLLEIEVLEYYDEYPVEGASVILYPSLTDWEKQTNYIDEGFTDADGKVVFAGLSSITYFVDVWEQTYDNYTLKSEDIGFIRTPVIIPNKINRFVAYVDYVDHGKGVGKGDRTMIIKKLERKAADKKQPETSSDITGWELLYNKRVNKK